MMDDMDRIKRDVHDVIAASEASARTATEGLEQLSRLLYDLQNARQIVSVDGAHKTEGQVLSARSALRRAREHTAALAKDLRDAMVATSGLTMVVTDHGDDDEPDVERDTLLGQHAPGLSPESSDAVRREMDRREAAGLPAVPEMSWED